MKGHRFQNGYSSLWALALVVGILLIAGCGGGGGGGSATGTTGSPNMALSRTSIDFGNQAIGQIADRSLMVLNTGNGDLVIGNIAVAQPSSPFSIYAASDTCSNKTLTPNNSCSIPVRFEPTVYGDFLDSFIIPSNAGDQTVNLTGNGRDLIVTITNVDTSGWDQIKLTVSVTDGSKTPVPNLLAANFSVIEQSSDVGAFVVDPINGGGPGLSIALTLDDSGSISDFFKLQIAEATKNFLNLLNLPPDEAAVIKFDSYVDVKQAFTTFLPDLLTAVDSPYSLPRDRGTIFYDAVHDSVTMVSDQLALNPSNNGAVIVISDGLDVDSDETLQSVILNAQGNGVTVHAIGFGDQLQSGIMQQLADETGGIFLQAPTEPDLETAYVAISDFIANQYEITFTTLRAQGTVNELTVDVVYGQLRGDGTVLVTY